MECKIVEDIGNGSPVEAERILSEILVLESGHQFAELGALLKH